MLSNEPNNYSNQRLRAEGGARGHQMVFRPPASIRGAVNDPDRAAQVIERYDIVLPRRGAATTRVEMETVKAFERAGTPVLNRSSSIALARDKLRTLDRLRRAGLRIPRTVAAVDATDVAGAWSAFKPPVVLKPVSGTHGEGVRLARSRLEAEVVVAEHARPDSPYLLQEFVEEAAGRDIRLFVVGDRVVAAMERLAAEGDFRANFHAGGRARPIDASSRLVSVAQRAVRAIDLDVAGVDVLISRSGPVVLEVNSGPGFQALERATQTNVAAAILELAEQRVQEVTA